jgi:hypothetical protein
MVPLHRLDGPAVEYADGSKAIENMQVVIKHGTRYGLNVIAIE